LSPQTKSFNWVRKIVIGVWALFFFLVGVFFCNQSLGILRLPRSERRMCGYFLFAYLFVCVGITARAKCLKKNAPTPAEEEEAEVLRQIEK
jgi:hypothetical protein